jgi:hypothetical protein
MSTASIPVNVSAPARFIRAYIECMLWSTNDESTESGGYPLEDNYGISDIAPATMNRIVQDCCKFYDEVEQAGISLDESNLTGNDADEQAGHDFWLTRCGHGCGFWEDDDWDNSDELDSIAKSYGEQWPYVGDDGLIYL